MIFVTVGTHEQQFNRLICEIDRLKYDGKIQEDVIIQTGYSTYKPQSCIWGELFSYKEMVKYVENARIVMTHGGPASIIMPLQIMKIPIVVPRKYQFNEHVNNHQLTFAKEISDRLRNIIVVEDISCLGDAIANYNETILSMPKEICSNNKKFNKELEEISYTLVSRR